MDFCVPHFDDVLVASSSKALHLTHLRIMFGRFQCYGVSLNSSKYIFGQPKISFLCHEISADDVRLLPERVSGVCDVLEQSTVPELRHFLSMLNFYRHLVLHAASAQVPLNAF